MRVQTKLARSGNSWSIRLSKEAIELSGLKPGQALDLEVRPGRLILRKPGLAAGHKLDQAYNDVKPIWDQALKDIWFQVFGPDGE